MVRVLPASSETAGHSGRSVHSIVRRMSVRSATATDAELQMQLECVLIIESKFLAGATPCVERVEDNNQP